MSNEWRATLELINFSDFSKEDHLSEIKNGRQLYQQFYGTNLAKEKEELMDKIKQQLIEGHLESVKQVIHENISLLKEELDIQLIQINLWGRKRGRVNSI